MSEDTSILLIFLIIHWVIVLSPVFLTGKWRSAIINFSIQIVYGSYFIYGLISGEPSSALAYYLNFIFIIAIHIIINSIQLFIVFSKNRKISISNREEINIYDWIGFWENYNLLYDGLSESSEKEDLKNMKNVIDGTPKGWFLFRQTFQNWIEKHKRQFKESEVLLIKKLLAELSMKTDLMIKDVL